MFHFLLSHKIRFIFLIKGTHTPMARALHNPGQAGYLKPNQTGSQHISSILPEECLENIKLLVSVCRSLRTFTPVRRSEF